MEKISKGLLEMLNQAIDLEKEGHKVYMDASKKAPGDFVKKVLGALADDEKKHIKALTEFYNNACKLKSCPLVKELFRKSHSQAKRTILNKSLKSLKESGSSARALKIYDAAKQLEEESYKFYKSALRKAKSKDEKKLLEFLVKEETAHYKLLDDTEAYLKNPKDWYLMEEAGVVEG